MARNTQRGRDRRVAAASLLAEAAQVVRFGLVGIAATACHYVVALLLATTAGAPLQLAHVTGFLAAVPVSFLGHYHWTFKSQADTGRAARRFFAVATTAFLVSAMALQGLDMFTVWEAEVAFLVSVLIIPAASYIINRAFVF